MGFSYEWDAIEPGDELVVARDLLDGSVKRGEFLTVLEKDGLRALVRCSGKSSLTISYEFFMNNYVRPIKPARPPGIRLLAETGRINITDKGGFYCADGWMERDPDSDHIARIVIKGDANCLEDTARKLELPMYRSAPEPISKAIEMLGDHLKTQDRRMDELLRLVVK